MGKIKEPSWFVPFFPDFSSFFPDLFPLFPNFLQFFSLFVGDGTLTPTWPPVATPQTLITRPLLKFGMRTFGSWIQNLDWHQVWKPLVLKTYIADAFYTIFGLGIITCFPEKRKRVHSNDKSWITLMWRIWSQSIKQLLFLAMIKNDVNCKMNWNMKLRRQKQNIMSPLNTGPTKYRTQKIVQRK